MPNEVLYGFHDLEHLWAIRVTEAGVELVGEAIQASLQEHNRQMDALLGLFVTKTTGFKTVFKTSSASRLQPLDEFGRARPIRRAGKYEIAFPLLQAGGAIAETYIASLKMTVGEVNDVMAEMQQADSRWLRDHILAALYANTSWTFTDVEHGSLTIKGLANGDTDTYLIRTGQDQSTTDQHYLAQAGAVSATDPFPAIYTEINEHPENAGGQVVALIPTSVKSDTEALASFYPIGDSNLRLGSGQTEFTGSLSVPTPGTVLGYHDAGVHIVEWPNLPADYIIAVATAGERPLKMREEPEPELQGFAQVATRENHPWYESQFLRIAGFGANNRVGAVVQRVGNGTYAVPTDYTSPMA